MKREQKKVGKKIKEEVWEKGGKKFEIVETCLLAFKWSSHFGIVYIQATFMQRVCQNCQKKCCDHSVKRQLTRPIKKPSTHST